MAGVYIHVPFCRQACHYCDFHFSTSLDYRDAMVDAMCREIELQSEFLEGEPVDSLYFGGGTPSLLDTTSLKRLIDRVTSLGLRKDAEVTLEANPDDASRHNLQLWLDAGVNRLSFGVQSFHDEILRFLNRIHTGADALNGYTLARQAGFKNISVDLIYGTPGLSDAMWAEDIAKVIELNPEHVSSYSLTIEERTVFGNWTRKGKLVPTDDDAIGAQLEMLMEQLQRAGYMQYEVSNFGKPGFESRHNSSYWLQKKYLGIGPSAHSYNGKLRQFNVKNNTRYIKAIDTGTVPAEQEVLTPEDKVNEYLLTRLRTTWGCDLKWIKENLGFDLPATRGAYIRELVGNGLATLDHHILILSGKGRLVADKIAADLFF